LHQSCFIVFNLFLIYAWIPAQGLTWLSASWTASSMLLATLPCPGTDPGTGTCECWWHVRLDGARGSQGHGRGRILCIHPPQALATSGISRVTPVLACSGTWADTGTGTGTGTGTNSFGPHRYIVRTAFKMPHLLSLVLTFFLYISKAAGSYSSFFFFSFSRPLHLPSCWALPLL
jgi:hypothetical protein